MAFQVVIVTPEAQALDEKAVQVILPAHDGLIGILTDRAPLLVKLGVGPLRVDLPGNVQRYFLVDGGVAQMKDNKLTVLTEEATPASEIDAEAARAEFAQGLALKASDEKAMSERQHQLDHARAAQTVAAHR